MYDDDIFFFAKGKGLDESQKLKHKMLLMITDLLAATASGENPGAASVCCTVFSVEELVSIISHEDISIYCKRPFMKFLVSVYMDEKGKKKPQILRNKYVKFKTITGIC